LCVYFFFLAEDGIRDFHVTGVQTCALPILAVTNDKVFPKLLDAVRENCEDRFEDVEHEALQAEGQRLIMADICARLSFLLWLYQIGRASCRERAWSAWSGVESAKTE